MRDFAGKRRKWRVRKIAIQPVAIRAKNRAIVASRRQSPSPADAAAKAVQHNTLIGIERLDLLAAIRDDEVVGDFQIERLDEEFAGK